MEENHFTNSEIKRKLYISEYERSKEVTTVKPPYNGPPIYRKLGQTENKFRKGVISHVK